MIISALIKATASIPEKKVRTDVFCHSYLIYFVSFYFLFIPSAEVEMEGSGTGCRDSLAAVVVFL